MVTSVPANGDCQGSLNWCQRSSSRRRNQTFSTFFVRSIVMKTSLVRHCRVNKTAVLTRQPSKRRRRVFLAAYTVAMMICLPGHGARAQDGPSRPSVECGVMAGGVGVTGAFRGKVTSGFVAGGAFQIPISPRRLALRADVLYQSIAGYAVQSQPVGYVGSSTSWTQVVSGSVSVVARLNGPETRWSPYLIAGAATYLVGTANSPLVATLHTNNFGLQGGLGLEVRSSKHVWFAEMRYMGISPGGVVPVVIGLRF